MDGAGPGGGHARRLTAGLYEPSTPCYSRDGRWLAFVGRDERHPEVYVMPAEGGPARRFTWLGTDTLVRGWTSDRRIVFVTTWFNDVGWAVENHGTDPDVEVDNAPQDAAAGRDRQLEAAVKTAMERCGAQAKDERDYGPRPVLARKALPPR